MDKYQEAFNSLMMNCLEDSGNPDMVWASIEEIARDLTTIKELVDRRNPMKPVGKYTDFKCGHCGTRVRSGKGSSSRVKDTVCRNCYQVIDWE